MRSLLESGFLNLCFPSVIPSMSGGRGRVNIDRHGHIPCSLWGHTHILCVYLLYIILRPMAVSHPTSMRLPLDHACCRNVRNTSAATCTFSVRNPTTSGVYVNSKSVAVCLVPAYAPKHPAWLLVELVACAVSIGYGSGGGGRKGHVPPQSVHQVGFRANLSWLYLVSVP